MKYLIIFSFILVNSCQKKQEKAITVDNLETKTDILNIHERVYFNKTNELEIKSINKDSLNFELIIANQQCAMPSFEGTLYKFSNNVYKGIMKPDIHALENDSNSLTLKYSNSNIILTSDDTIDNGKLGFYCWIEGIYTKKQ
jgi:hypothetical protein